MEIWSASNYRARYYDHKLDGSHRDSASTPIRIRRVSSWRPYDKRGFARRPIRANCPRGTVNSQLADDLNEVVHSDRGENIGIISARKTTLRERKHYEEEN